MGPSGKGIHTLQKAILGGGLYPLFLENVSGPGRQMKDALGASLGQLSIQPDLRRVLERRRAPGKGFPQALVA